MSQKRNGVDTDGKAKPAKLSASSGKDDAVFRGYVNLTLNGDEKAAWAKWSKTTAVWDVLVDQVQRGVNVSVKRDLKNAVYVGSATQRDPASPNAGLCVTARGSTADVAFSRVLFCLVVLDRTESWEDTQPVADPDRW